MTVMMSLVSSCTTTLLFITLTSLGFAVWAKANSDLDLPTVRIFQVSENNQILRPWDKIQNSETVIENVDNLRLECSANHPVQWIYSGNGIPVLTSNISLARSQRNNAAQTEYKASAFISPLKEQHTGKYQCSSTEYLDLATYFYIYVPGQALFTSLNGKNIYVPKNDSRILLPCSVSNPKIAVTLEKSVEDVLQKPETTSDDAIIYDPKVGFYLDLTKIEDPEGTYVCTARYKNLVRGVEYTVFTSFSPFNRPQRQQASTEPVTCKRTCGENAECVNQNGQEICKCKDSFNGDPNDSCEHKCESHNDCPQNMSCYTDRFCRDPCIHSIRCGTDSKCKVVDQRPICFCPDEFVGDPMKQCFNTLQGAASDSSSVSKDTSTPECKSDDDCTKEQYCRKTQCVDPCLKKRCGLNAQCRTENHAAVCTCISGYNGDPYTDCSPKEKEDEVKTKINAETESICTPDVCGPNSECSSEANGEKKCRCKEGYLGTAPNCRPQCETNKDCELNKVCLTFSKPYPTCEEVCGNRICGSNATCHPEPAFCICKAGFIGDPYRGCDDKSSRLGLDCNLDIDCGHQLRCETGANYRRCVDPCIRQKCKPGSQCKVDFHVARCTCPDGYTGSPDIGCIKDFVLDKIVSSSSSRCGSSLLRCGLNSECRVIDNNPTCFCQSGYVGQPPHCRQECITNIDCPANKACVQKRCRSACHNKCGRNSRCRVASTPDRSAICTCPAGFEGNANIECIRIENPNP